MRIFSIFLVLLASLCLAQETAPVRRSTVERMSPARLKVVHEDAERLRKQRKDLPAPSGLNDYRAVFHAHAEDSAHTGGTRPEMLAEAKKAGVKAVFLSDHHRPPKDFINDSWRGLHEGVLFIPGSEANGFLIAPTHSVMSKMELPKAEFIKAVKEDGGLIFLSHIEERVDHSMDQLDGMEIYNRHYDAKKDTTGLFSLILKLTDPASLKELESSLAAWPEALFAFHVEYPKVYMEKWDRETKTRKLTGVAANDCHHNQILIVKMVDESKVLVGTNVDRDDQMRPVTTAIRPGIKALTKGRKPGDVLARVDLDPYARSFLNVSTHILAPKLDEPTLRDAVREGKVYVSHDWICDPTGFRFEAETPDGRTWSMGSELKSQGSAKLKASFPIPCRIRLIQDGKIVAKVEGDRLEQEVKSPGVYRVEAWVLLDGEERPWIYGNPIYIR